jgi:hypothetical protein
VTACGGKDNAAAPQDPGVPLVSTGAGNFALLGFADHAGPNNYPPPDISKPGGTIRACNPASIYAFVDFAARPVIKPMVGRWSVDGTEVGEQAITPTANGGSLFLRLQNTDGPIAAGAYLFELSSDGMPLTRGRFTLAC